MREQGTETHWSLGGFSSHENRCHSKQEYGWKARTVFKGQERVRGIRGNRHSDPSYNKRIIQQIKQEKGSKKQGNNEHDAVEAEDK